MCRFAGRWVSCRTLSFIPPIFRTAMAVVAILPGWRTGAWRLQIVKRIGCCCPNGGSSNERSYGFVVTVVWLATLNATQRDRCCIHPPRHDPHHAQATCRKCLAMNPNFPDGLLVIVANRFEVVAQPAGASTLADPKPQ